MHEAPEPTRTRLAVRTGQSPSVVFAVESVRGVRERGIARRSRIAHPECERSRTVAMHLVGLVEGSGPTAIGCQWQLGKIQT